MKNIHFRVKRMTLAAEARIIKAEEAKALRIARALKRSNKGEDKTARAYATLMSLHHHRINVVRPAARAMHLAHAYLKGMAYARVEAKAHLRSPLPLAVMNAAAENIRKFGAPVFADVKSVQVLKWVDGGMTVAQEAAAKAAAEASEQSAA